MLQPATTRSHRTRRSLGAAAAAAAALLAIAACSSSGGSGSAAASGSASGAAKLTKLNVAIVSAGADQTPFYAAINQGFFQKAGLDVTPVTAAGGPEAADAAMASGSVDIELGGIIEFIEDSSKKAISGKVFGLMTDRYYDVLGASGISSMSQLKGKTIGISATSGTDQVYLEAVLQHYGITTSDVTYLAVGSPTTRLTVLGSGRVSAIELPVSQVPASDASHVLLSPTDSPVQVPAAGFFARSQVIATEQPALRAFMKAMGQADAWVAANPKAAVTDCEKTGATAAACSEAIAVGNDKAKSSPYTWSSTGAIDTTSVAAAITAAEKIFPSVNGMTVAALCDTAIAGASPS